MTWLIRLGRALTPTAWLTLAVLGALLIFGGYCAYRGADSERDRQAQREVAAERRAGDGRERAASERQAETTTITDLQRERDHAAEAIPDGLPDDRELRRRCRQLRDAGRDLPACR